MLKGKELWVFTCTIVENMLISGINFVILNHNTNSAEMLCVEKLTAEAENEKNSI